MNFMLAYAFVFAFPNEIMTKENIYRNGDQRENESQNKKPNEGK